MTLTLYKALVGLVFHSTCSSDNLVQGASIYLYI